MADHALLRSDTSSCHVLLIPLSPNTVIFSKYCCRSNSLVYSKDVVGISKMQQVEAGSNILRAEIEGKQTTLPLPQNLLTATSPTPTEQ